MARQYYVTGNNGDARREEAIIRLCSRATEIDPGYARAWSLMALTQNMQRYLFGVTGDGGLSSVNRALALNSNLAEAHAVKARILSEDGRDDESSRELAAALALDPESYEVNRVAAYLSYKQRRLEDAIRFYEKAATLMETDFHSPGLLKSFTPQSETRKPFGVRRRSHWPAPKRPWRRMKATVGPWVLAVPLSWRLGR